MGELSFFVCAESSASGEVLRERLQGCGHARVEAVLIDPGAIGAELEARRVDALLVELGPDPRAVLEALAKLPPPRPLLLVSGPQKDSELVLRAMRLGVREFFGPEPSEVELRSAVERLLLENGNQGAAHKRDAPIIAVVGSKGGIGATTVACQLAAELQRHASTAIVDLDLRSGDVALYFDVVPGFTLGDLRAETEELDATFLRTLLESHECGVRILAAPSRIEDMELLDVPNLEHALQILRHEFSWIVLDVSRSWSEASLRALELADQILLVTSFELAPLNHAREQLELLGRLGLSDRVRVIANRQSPQEAVTTRDVTSFLKRRPDLCIPNDFEAASASIAQGRPLGVLVPGAPLARAYQTLAQRLHEWCDVPLREVAGAGTRWRRWFRRLRRRPHVTA